MQFAKKFVPAIVTILLVFLFGCATVETSPSAADPEFEQSSTIEDRIMETVQVPEVEVVEVTVEATVPPTEIVVATPVIPPTIEIEEHRVYWSFSANLNPVTFETSWKATSDSVTGARSDGRPFELMLTCTSLTVDFGEHFPNASARYVDLGERYFTIDDDGEVTGYSDSIVYGWLPLGTQLAIFDTDVGRDFVEEFIANRFNNPNYNAIALSITSPITNLPLVGWWRTDDFGVVYESMRENCPKRVVPIVPTPVAPSPTPIHVPTPVPTPTPADSETATDQEILDNMPPWATSWIYNDRGDVIYVGPGELSVGLSRTIAQGVVRDMYAGAICNEDISTSGQPIICEFPDRLPITLYFGIGGLTHWEDGVPSYSYELSVGLTESQALTVLGLMWNGSASCSRGGSSSDWVCQNGDQTESVTLRFDSDGKLVSW